MPQRVLIAGVGVTPFSPLTARASLPELAGRAVRMALEDARIDYDLIDQVFMSSVNTAVGVSEQLLMQIGLSGIPLFCMRDGGVSASTAVHLARNSILAGEAEAILVLGFEDLQAGTSKSMFFGLDNFPGDDGSELIRPGDPLSMLAQRDHPAALYAAQMSWLQAHMGLTEQCVERVLQRARTQARLNPGALADACEPGEWLPPYLCPPACGAAAVLLCSEAFAGRYGSRGGVAMLGSARASETLSELAAGNLLDVLGRAATRRAAAQAYAQAGVGVEDLDVVELHDQSVGDYLVFSAALGLCEEGEMGEFALRTQTKPVVCPSGGLLGCGLVPGASALAQLAELVRQLRGEAGARQVPGARVGLQHSAAVGRSVTVTILQRV
ncbi:MULTISPECIES: acetyl-CoA acetyltransferase [unclassified Pseudomonas]|uniref:thiolase C-terminal domain-containing protein n=1 Tax=unclassified Pseudomonas TaxID=196821 RepID=UPI00244D40FA|nr:MULTISPECIES: acetyl-CoA acetyltransferase [unclassified Pseudomonas]MDG9924435.1 acetyl-CoA acetyltransferase [Pseudomonas sp. GD04045]MDH0035225.1 acetyl-CoA acetyltransferase [Pseudomonas sp. GD04019]